jgi:hypothetical protein
MADEAPRSLQVSARITSDDGQSSADFDAAPWIDNASDDEIAELESEGWSSSYAADNVAYDLQDKNKDIEAVLDHARTADKRGFEVSIDAEEAARYVEMKRSGLTVETVGNALGALSNESDVPTPRSGQILSL